MIQEFTFDKTKVTFGRKGLAMLLESSDAPVYGCEYAPLYTCEPAPLYGCAAVQAGVKVRRIGSKQYFEVERVMGDIVFTDDGTFRREYVREVRS